MRRHQDVHPLEPEIDRSRRIQMMLPDSLGRTIDAICALTGERPADAIKRIVHLGAPEDLKRLTRRAA